MVKRVIFLILLIGYIHNIRGQEKYYEKHDVVGIYFEVSEREAKDNYHYIEYDDHYYIKEFFDEGENGIVKILQRINQQLYKVELTYHGIHQVYFMYLRYPAFLMQNDFFTIELSQVVDSEITQLPVAE